MIPAGIPYPNYNVMRMRTDFHCFFVLMLWMTAAVVMLYFGYVCQYRKIVV